MSARNRLAATTAVGSALVVLLAGCGLNTNESGAIANLDLLPGTSTTSTTTSAPTARQRQCDEADLATASFPPADSLDPPPGSFVDQLRREGRIRVGVDENTIGFSVRNSNTGELEGFEVELAHAIAERVFGSAYRPQMVELVPLVTDDKVRFVQDGAVDMTISAVSMSCSRWEKVSFSREYFTAHQEFLVRSDSDISSVDDLDGRTVCVTAGSSSIGIMDKHVPGAVLLPVAARTDCLVALQYGEADAYFGHDSFLYGMRLQDPTVVILSDLLDPALTVSHYGIAINREHEDFVRFVNAVLDSLIEQTVWQQSADTWIEGVVGIPDPTPPAADYRRSD